MERRLRMAGVLLILGLVVEALSLFWNTAFSFLSFMFIGGAFFVAGVLVYLYSFVRKRPGISPGGAER